jgi:iron complex outermembrane receptor protein
MNAYPQTCKAQFRFLKAIFTIALSATTPLAFPADPDNATPTGSTATGGGVALVGLSLEELMNVEVTSVSRKDQQLRQVAAAVYVITAEEIRRSGATSVPDALRVVPGIEVAQISSGIWAISARGFNSRESNKILVLVDGRSIYNNLFSGTFWDQNQVPLENIERIEVIRGPGATMWGANAVDGVISIITKTAKNTQGMIVETQVSQNELPDTTVRYGGHAGNKIQYRLDATFTEGLPLLTAGGAGAGDRWNSGEGGGRIDWQLSERDSLTTDGQFYKGGGNEEINPAFPLPSGLVTVEPYHFNGGFVRTRWERHMTKSDLALEVSYTQEARYEWISGGVLRTADIDFQHHIPLGRHDLNWGGGYRFRDDDGIGLIRPADVTESLFSLFVQDEFSLIPSHLSLTGGVKVQDFHDTTGCDFAIQPQLRLLWTPSKASSFWSAVSRAIRTPSETERDLFLTVPLGSQNGLPVEGEVVGNPNLPGEVVIAYEAGYRQQLSKRISVDIAGFFNHYTNLIQSVNEAPYVSYSPVPEIVVPDTYEGTGHADTHGIELSASWAPRNKWRLRGSYAWEVASLQSPVSPALSEPPGSTWATPEHVASVRSYWDVTRHWDIDASVYVASSIVGQPIPGYARVDFRVARKFGEGGEFSVGAQNLLDSSHTEFRSDDYIVASYMRRNIFARVIWRF